MSTVTVSFRTDKDVKKQADSLFAELGMNMSVAVNTFLRQAIREGRIPFEISTHTPNAQTDAAIQEGKRLLEDESVSGYKDRESLRKALGI